MKCNDDATRYMCNICSLKISGIGRLKFKRLKTTLRASRGPLAYVGYNCNELVIASFFSGTRFRCIHILSRSINSVLFSQSGDTMSINERETILHNLYDKRQAQAVAVMEGDSERADTLQEEIDGLNADMDVPAYTKMTLHKVYVHDSVSYCVVLLWADTPTYARQRAVETACKYDGLKLFDSIHASVQEREAPVTAQDSPHIIERGNR